MDAPAGTDVAVVTPDAAPPPDVREMLLDAALPCSDGGTCTAPGTCCGGFCVDTTKDPRHCGACDKACSITQFCTGKDCAEAIFANVCGNPNALVVKDYFDIDNHAAETVGAALTMSCTPPPALMERDQKDPGVLTPSGRALGGSGTSYLMGGGGVVQLAVDYLDKTDMTPVFLTGDATIVQLHNRGTGDIVVSTAPGALTDGHDYFYLQMFVEPLSGTLCVSAIGMLAPGTAAAGYWLSTEIIPKRAMYTDTWYAYEWTDDGDKVPNAADTFRLIAHGR